MAEEKSAELQEFDAELPGGVKFRTKGYRIGDVCLVLLLVALCAIGYMMWEHKGEEKTAKVETTSALKEIAVSQRLFACIIAQDQAVRLAEFSNENSFCARMSKLR